jgi:hypothetical protein
MSAVTIFRKDGYGPDCELRPLDNEESVSSELMHKKCVKFRLFCLICG